MVENSVNVSGYKCQLCSLLFQRVIAEPRIESDGSAVTKNEPVAEVCLDSLPRIYFRHPRILGEGHGFNEHRLYRTLLGRPPDRKRRRDNLVHAVAVPAPLRHVRPEILRRLTRLRI